MNIYFIEPNDTGGGGYISRGLYRYHILMEGYKIVTDPQKADIIHGYGPGTIQSVVHYGQKYGIPTFINLNGIKYSLSMSYYKHKYLSPRYYRNKYIIVLLMSRVTHFFTLNNFFKNQWINDGIPEHKFSVIPNMIDKSFPIYGRYDSDTIRMLYIGEKSHYRLPSIANKVYEHLKKEFKCSLEIIYSNVKYRHMPEFYRNSDIYLQPMKFPICTTRALIESMSYGICPVIYGWDSISPIVKDNINGLLINSQDANTWFGYLQELLTNKELITKYGKQASKDVWKICHPDKIIKQYIKAYENYA